MADPTAAAYQRINPRGIVRPHTANAILLPDVDLGAAIDYTNKFGTWATIRDCYDGEEVIKAAGEQYLPELSAHTPGE